VTVLWSTSWVLIKIGLQDIPSLTFAGLRYTLAFLCLLPFALRPHHRASLRALPRAMWLRIVALGVIYYAVTQGSQFVALQYLPAATTSLTLSFTAVLVAFLGVVFLGEHPTALQWAGGALYLVGVLVYVGPAPPAGGRAIGFIAAGVGVVANAVSAILGRYVNRSDALPPTVVTVVSMGIGAALLLVAGLTLQGLPRLSAGNWAAIAWLAVVNTALAFTLWNHSLRTLSAMESTVINNTMLFQIAVLAWAFLGESLTWHQIAGMVVAGAGTFIVQRRARPGTATDLERAASDARESV